MVDEISWLSEPHTVPSLSCHRYLLCYNAPTGAGRNIVFYYAKKPGDDQCLARLLRFLINNGFLSLSLEYFHSYGVSIFSFLVLFIGTGIPVTVSPFLSNSSKNQYENKKSL
jgi:hypothetical protein